MAHDSGLTLQKLTDVAEQIQAQTGKTAPFGDLSTERIVSEIQQVGNTVVHDVTLNTKINPGLTACRAFSNCDLDVASLTVGQFIEQSPGNQLRNCCCGGEVSLHIISWSGQNEHPLGIEVAARFGKNGAEIERHTLATIDYGEIFDIHNKQIGVYEYLSDSSTKGTAILALIAKGSS